MRWEKIIIICFLACHWRIKHNKNNKKLFQYYHFYTWCFWVSLNDLSSIFRAEVIWEISIYSHHVRVSQISTTKDWSFVLKRFVGAGFSSYSWKSSLFWISIEVIWRGRPSVIRMNTRVAFDWEVRISDFVIEREIRKRISWFPFHRSIGKSEKGFAKLFSWTAVFFLLIPFLACR